MKTWLPLAISAILAATAAAEDLNLMTGAVIRDVTIEWADDRGVTVRPNTFAATSTKYPWTWFHPAEADRIRAITNKMADDRAAKQAIEASAVHFLIKVTTVADNGLIVRACPVKEGIDQATGKPTTVPDGDWLEQPIFIYTNANAKVVDGDMAVVKVYPAGIKRYTTAIGARKTVRAYAGTPENAAIAKASEESRQAKDDE